MPRRHRTILAAVAFAAAVAAGPALAQKSKDTMRIAVNDPFSLLDLYHFPQDEVGNFYRSVGGTLVTFNEHTQQFVGELAKAWRRVEPTVLEFDLRDDVVFHSGNKFTSADVKYTLDYLRDPKVKIRFKARYNWVKEVQVLGPYKLRIVANKPRALDMSDIAYRFYMLDSVVHKGLEDPATYGRVSASGTGPYKMVKIDRADGVFLERFDRMVKWPHLRAPAKRVHGIWMPDRQTQVAQLLTRGVDVLYNVPADLAKDVKGQRGIAVTPRPSKQLMYITMDAVGRSSSKVMTDERVRRAVIKAIDREGLIRNFIAGAEVAERPRTICFRTTAACKPTTEVDSYDPEAAKRLLAEAGHPNGFDLTLYVFNPIREAGAAIAGELRKVGIRASVEALPLASYVRKRGAGEFTAFVGYYPTAGQPDTGNLLNFFFGANRDYWNDPLIDKAAAAGETEFDLAKRTALYTPAIDQVNKHAYIFPITELPSVYAHSTDVKIAESLTSTGATRIHDIMWK